MPRPVGGIIPARAAPLHCLAYRKLRNYYARMLREDLSRNFGFLVNDVARLMRTAYDRRIRKLGLTRAQWWVLTHLFRGDGVSQTELAETLEIEKPTLGRLLDRLEAKRWIRREHDARDRRIWRVHLTEEVEPALRTMRAIAAELRRDALAGLSAAERERFVDTLLRIKSNLQRDR
jgi:MarR family transcriptional regulator for hemolysin